MSLQPRVCIVATPAIVRVGVIATLIGTKRLAAVSEMSGEGLTTTTHELLEIFRHDEITTIETLTLATTTTMMIGGDSLMSDVTSA